MKTSPLSGADEAFIRDAALFLERPGAVLAGLNWIGGRVESAVGLLPPPALQLIHRASRAAIEKAFAVALTTLRGQDETPRSLSFRQAALEAASSAKFHIGLAGASGALGGLFGFAALPLELPVATVIMLRGIAAMAALYGNDLDERDTQLECLYVFSMGSEGKGDDALESAYYSSRIAFAELLRQSAGLLAGAGAKEILSALERGAAPFMARLLGEISSKFELRVANKAIAQGAPLIGAIGGAGVNALFARYFQECARFHFGLRRLERERGYEATRAVFEAERAKIRGAL